MVGKTTKLRTQATLRAGAFAPALCKPQQTAPAGEDWLHESKWDGYRLLATIKQGKVRLWSRNAIEWTARLPDIVRALQALRIGDAQLDGELIAPRDGRSDFNLLKARLSGDKDTPLVYALFDLPYLDRPLARLPLIERKARLESLLAARSGTALRYSTHLVGGGDAAFDQAVAQGLEGIVSKRVDSAYRAGRSGDWVKTKARQSDEFVVVGYTAPRGSRAALGALLLARAAGDGWHYAGRCGTGFDERMLRQLKARLRKLAVDAPAIDPALLEPRIRATVQWLRPECVVEVFYAGRGGQGLLRHPVFKTIREDKNVSDLLEPGAHKPRPPARSRNAEPASQAEVRLTHPDRLMYEDAGISKADVAAYYRAVMPQLLAAIAKRPLAVVRCPDGVGHESFFQKHAGKGWGEHIHAALSNKARDADPYLYIEDAAGVLELVQMNTIEFHPWGSTLPEIDRADRVVLDLDPAPGVPWQAVKQAAIEVRELLESIGLQSYLRATGGKGLHVVLPLSPAAPWARTREFAHALAATLAQAQPERFVDVASKAKREGRIFIDWLRNGRGSTSVASYSLRARPGAKVAVPLAWQELSRLKAGDAFDLKAVVRRVRKLKADPWQGIDSVRQCLDGVKLK